MLVYTNIQYTVHVWRVHIFIHVHTQPLTCYTCILLDTAITHNVNLAPPSSMAGYRHQHSFGLKSNHTCTYMYMYIYIYTCTCYSKTCTLYVPVCLVSMHQVSSSVDHQKNCHSYLLISSTTQIAVAVLFFKYMYKPGRPYR